MTVQAIAASRRAELDAALLLLAKLGVSPADLFAGVSSRPPVPTFAEFVPAVAGAVSAGTLKAYGTYWKRLVEHWGERRIDEPTPLEIERHSSDRLPSVQ